MTYIKKQKIRNMNTKYLQSNFSLLTTIFIATSCSNVKNIENNNSDKPIISEEIINEDNFFPILYQEDYYEYIEFNKNAKPIIGDKFIMKVIEDVVSRVASSKGIIEFSVIKYSDSIVDFNFKWSYLDIVLYKTYSFEIKIS